MDRRGTATLPLHSGSAPRWLFDRMVDLGGAIAETVVAEYGRTELLRRLADPYWFQALGCVLGFDWHSSGVTTTTMGALKAALDPAEHGVAVAGGKGATSRRTPEEVRALPYLDGSAGRRLADHSRTSATVDDACVQDGYTLYHHTMVVTEDGEWCVVQQGMGEETARRYHWLSESVDDLVVEPQSAICTQQRRDGVLDMTAGTSAEARAVSVDLVNDDPAHLKRYLRDGDQQTLSAFGGGAGAESSDGAREGGARDATPTGGTTTGVADPVEDLRMPDRHELRLADLGERAIDQLQAAYEVQPADYEELISVDGVGPKSLRALALVAELVHDAGAAREDPAKYAYAHGGKDGTPAPVDRERYDRSIEHLRAALAGAPVDDERRGDALDRLAALTDG